MKAKKSLGTIILFICLLANIAASSGKEERGLYSLGSNRLQTAPAIRSGNVNYLLRSNEYMTISRSNLMDDDTKITIEWPKYQAYFPMEPPGKSGTYGLVIDKNSSTIGGHGIVFSTDGIPYWAIGCDYEAGEGQTNELVLAYVPGVGDQLRLHPKGFMVYGPSVSHPNLQNRFELNSLPGESFQNFMLIQKNPGAAVAYFLNCYDGDNQKFYVSTNGFVYAVGPLWTDGNNIRIGKSMTPASSSAHGVRGQIGFDSDYAYFCVDTNTWKRVPLESW